MSRRGGEGSAAARRAEGNNDTDDLEMEFLQNPTLLNIQIPIHQRGAELFWGDVYELVGADA